MGRKHLNLMEKNTRTAIHIEEAYQNKYNERLPFGQILDKFAYMGESCDTIAEKLHAILGPELNLKHSTFGNAVRLAIQQNKTQFRIHGRFANNPLRKTGTGLRIQHPKSKPHLLKHLLYVHCVNCNKKYTEKVKTPPILLDLFTCKKCGVQGKSSVIYEVGDNRFLKIQQKISEIVEGVTETDSIFINFTDEEKNEFIEKTS